MYLFLSIFYMLNQIEFIFIVLAFMKLRQKCSFRFTTEESAYGNSVCFLLPNALFVYISFHAKDLHERTFNVLQSTYMIYIFVRPK